MQLSTHLVQRKQRTPSYRQINCACKYEGEMCNKNTEKLVQRDKNNKRKGRNIAYTQAPFDKQAFEELIYCRICLLSLCG